MIVEASAAMEEELEAGVGEIRGRRFQPLVWDCLKDFTLLWRDLESVESGMPLDRSRILDAARRLARREDELIFFGRSGGGSNRTGQHRRNCASASWRLEPE